MFYSAHEAEVPLRWSWDLFAFDFYKLDGPPDLVYFRLNSIRPAIFRSEAHMNFGNPPVPLAVLHLLWKLD